MIAALRGPQIATPPQYRIKLLAANKLKQQGMLPPPVHNQINSAPLGWQLNRLYWMTQQNKSPLCWASTFSPHSPTLTLLKPIISISPHFPPAVPQSEDRDQITHVISVPSLSIDGSAEAKRVLIKDGCLTEARQWFCSIQMLIRNSIEAVVSEQNRSMVLRSWGMLWLIQVTAAESL